MENRLNQKETYPDGWAVCYLEECKLKDTCLHHLYTHAKHSTSGNAILPPALEEENLAEGRCMHYADSEPVVCHKGFTHLFDEVLAKDEKDIKDAVRTCLGGNRNYYRYAKGENFYRITPEKEKAIALIFKSYGYDAPKYDEEYIEYNFR